MIILVTGACGHKGIVLAPKLLARDHEVVAFDVMWFGNHLKPHPRLKVVRGDVRNIDEVPLDGVDAIIHLSSVANDPCGDLDPKLTREVSALATKQLADRALRKGVKRFIYASSGSVYGIKDEAQVTEDLELKPISEMDIAKQVTTHAEAEIVVAESNDPRSYRVNSDKLLATGFRLKKSVGYAIREIIEKYNSGELKDKERFYNLKWMQREVVK